MPLRPLTPTSVIGQPPAVFRFHGPELGRLTRHIGCADYLSPRLGRMIDELGPVRSDLIELEPRMRAARTRL
jgi:hypothetical protein